MMLFRELSRLHTEISRHHGIIAVLCKDAASGKITDGKKIAQQYNEHLLASEDLRKQINQLMNGGKQS